MPPVITPVAPASAPAASTTPQTDARARAIAKLTNQEPPPVQNPNQVSPEELSAIKPPEQSQSDTTEAPPARADSEAKPKEDPLSTQYANLARKEKALRAKVHAEQAAAKSREDAYAAREEALKAKEAEYQTKYIPKERLAQDTLSVLSELGISYDQLTNMVLNGPKPEELAINNEIKALRAELQALKGTQDEAQKTYKDNQTQQYQQAVNQIRNDVKNLVQNDEAYEMVKATSSVNDVVELITSTFNDGLGDEYPKGTILSVDVAAQLVEDHLVEEAIKIARLKKIQSRLAPPPAAAPTKQEAPKQQPMKTLTNAVGTQRPLTAKERAIAAFKGELKS